MYIITDFSLEKYIEAAGETLDDLTESFKQKLYNDLGISSYLRDDQCNISSEDHWILCQSISCGDTYNYTSY
jgi:hypothetical protein